MKKQITNNTLKRGIRTFFQAFFGAFVTAGANVMWNEVDIGNAILGIFITSIFAGLTAIAMNLETVEVEKDVKY